MLGKCTYTVKLFTASKGSNNYINAAGAGPCGGPKMSPRISSIVQIICFF